MRDPLVGGNSLKRLMVGQEKVDNIAECEKNSPVRVDLVAEDVY